MELLHRSDLHSPVTEAT